jgi:hypothetical protein
MAGAVLWFAVLAAAWPAYAQGRGGGAPGVGAGAGQAPPGTGVIIGRVVEGNGTTPVPGAVVQISGGALGRGGSMFAAASGAGAGPRAVEVSASGEFVFTALPKGSYNIDVTAAGYLPGQYGQTRPPSPIPRALDVVRQLDLADGETKTDVAVRMWQLAAITGTVLDEYGQPLVGLDVRLTAVSQVWMGRMTTNMQVVRTDDRGIYRAEVPPGDYIVGVGTSNTTMPAPMVEDAWRAMSNAPPGGAMFNGFNGQATPPLAGQRVGDLIVGPSNQSTSAISWLWTRADGGPTYVYPTTYYPAVGLSTMASVITVEPGAERSGIDLQLTPQPAFRVSGHLVGPSGAVGGVTLRLIGADFNTKTTSNPLFIPAAVTDANGAFTFVGITAGQYTLDAAKFPPVARQGMSITVSNGSGGSSMGFVTAPSPATTSEAILYASQPIAVDVADLSDVVVNLIEAARLAGRFEFPASAPPPTADQLRVISVGVRVQPGTVAGRLSGNGIGLTTVTDESGTFRTSELVPGPYLIVANRLPAGWSLRSAMTGGKDAADVPIEIGPGGLTDLVMAFTNKSTTLTGVVTGDDNVVSVPGLPTPTPTVVVFSTDQSLWPKVALAPRTLRSVGVTVSQPYQVTGLPAGEYFVAASSSAVDFTDSRVLLVLCRTAARVTLVEGESRTQDVRAVLVPAIK